MPERMYSEAEVQEIKTFYEEKIKELEDSVEYWQLDANYWRTCWEEYFDDD